jgi:hypothetical protein
MCYNSGASSLFLPEEDEWMLDKITDANPDVGVEVASGTVLGATKIGAINSGPVPTVVVDTFALRKAGATAENFTSAVATVTAPHHSRALIVRGMKAGTRLVGVTYAKRYDGINTYTSMPTTPPAWMSACGSRMAASPSSTITMGSATGTTAQAST